jgi:chromosome segregation ATPase
MSAHRRFADFSAFSPRCAILAAEGQVSLMGDVSQDILEEIKRLGVRFDRMEVRMGSVDTRLESMDAHLGSVDTRLGSMDARLGSVDARLGSVETRLTSMDARLGLAETRLEAMDTRLLSTNARLGSLESRATSVEDAVADLASRIKSWPDMHYLAAAAKAQLGHSREIKTDVADLKMKMEEIYRSMATSSEIQVLREEVSRFRDQSVEIDVRLGAIEARLGIESVP